MSGETTGTEQAMTRPQWRRRCLARDAIVIAAWLVAWTGLWYSLRTHAAVTILKQMFRAGAPPGGGGYGNQVIYFKDGKLTEIPFNTVTVGAMVNWSCFYVALGEKGRPFYEDASFTIGTLTPRVASVTVADIKDHIRREGVPWMIGGDVARMLTGSDAAMQRLHESKVVAVEHPENVVAGIRVLWPRVYWGAWAVFGVGLVVLGLTARSVRVWRRWAAGRCTRCGYEAMGAEVCPECGLFR